MVVVEKARGGSKTLRKCCCWCCTAVTAPVRKLASWVVALLAFGLIVVLGLSIAVGYLADWKTAAVSTIQSLQTTVASYFSSSATVRMSFVGGAPAAPWAPWTLLASGWIEYSADAVALNITAVAGISLTQLVRRPLGGGASTNVTYAPVGFSAALPAPAVLAAWQRGDLFYLLLLAMDGSVTASVLLPVS